jgi:hypothetical protein
LSLKLIASSAANSLANNLPKTHSPGDTGKGDRSPTKAQFVKVYGPKGPSMTWAQRANAGVDAKHFQAALAAKNKA